MTVKFGKRETRGGGWSLEVRRSGQLIGHIHRGPDSDVYRYFRSADNELTPAYESTDLEALKRQVQSNP
jgi:hypothetical protein